MNILQMSISAGLLAVAVVIIRAVALNRLPKITFLILWGIVLLRLFIPVTIPSQYSAYNIVDNVFHMEAPVVSISENVLPVNDDASVQNMPVMQVQESKIGITTAIWLIGMLVAISLFAVIYFKNHRVLRSATPLIYNDFLNEWLAKYKLNRQITVLQSDRVTTPITVGLLKPRIILPTSMNMNDTEVLAHVLTHEYYHIRHCDAIWKILLAIVVCAHWFNPMIWVMFVLVNRDLELSCDEMVIRCFGTETKTAYANTLIKMAEQKNELTPLYSGFSKNATEERIVSIMKYRKTTFATTILVMLLVIGTVTAFAASLLTVGADNVNGTITAENLVTDEYSSYEAANTWMINKKFLDVIDKVKAGQEAFFDDEFVEYMYWGRYYTYDEMMRISQNISKLRYFDNYRLGFIRLHNITGQIAEFLYYNDTPNYGVEGISIQIWNSSRVDELIDMGYNFSPIENMPGYYISSFGRNLEPNGFMYIIYDNTVLMVSFGSILPFTVSMPQGSVTQPFGIQAYTLYYTLSDFMKDFESVNFDIFLNMFKEYNLK